MQHHMHFRPVQAIKDVHSSMRECNSSLGSLHERQLSLDWSTAGQCHFLGRDNALKEVSLQERESCHYSRLAVCGISMQL